MVGVVTMNRPDALNCFNAELRRELLRAVREVNADDALRVAVLAGAGRAFGAGADLTEDPGPDFQVEDLLNGEYKPILLAIAGGAKPWISAVQGPCAGISSAFAMTCDLSVMSEEAYLYQAFAAIGLVPDGGATWHLVRTLGRRRAYELIVSGEKLPARRCLELGLCNRVVPTGQALDAALAWAEELGARAPLALQHSKALVYFAGEEGLDRTISEEARRQQLCIESEDAREGTTAFLEKRAPVWQGR
jgi:2-(1,2-epoxy-1,2-dihydrophenyl)acetyl-CoA isomerase